MLLVEVKLVYILFVTLFRRYNEDIVNVNIAWTDDVI